MVGEHDKMGSNSVPLKDLTPDEPKKTRGHTVMVLTYKAFNEEDLEKDLDDYAPEAPAGGDVLVVRIQEGEAQDLEGKQQTNPHARIIFRGEERNIKTVKKNRDSRWDQQFQFVLEEPPTNGKMHIEVYSTSSRNILRNKGC